MTDEYLTEILAAAQDTAARSANAKARGLFLDVATAVNKVIENREQTRSVMGIANGFAAIGQAAGESGQMLAAIGQIMAAAGMAESSVGTLGTASPPGIPAPPSGDGALTPRELADLMHDREAANAPLAPDERCSECDVETPAIWMVTADAPLRQGHVKGTEKIAAPVCQDHLPCMLLELREVPGVNIAIRAIDARDAAES